MTTGKRDINCDTEFAAALKALKEARHHLLMASWAAHETAVRRFAPENAAMDGLFDGAADMLARQVNAIETETRRLRKAVRAFDAYVQEDGE